MHSRALSLLPNNFKITEPSLMFAYLKEFTEKTQLLLKFMSSKKDQLFTKDLTLTLHEDFESEVVLHGKSKQ